MNIHGQAQPSTPRTTKNNQDETQAGHFLTTANPRPGGAARRRGETFYFGGGAGDPH